VVDAGPFAVLPALFHLILIFGPYFVAPGVLVVLALKDWSATRLKYVLLPALLVASGALALALYGAVFRVECGGHMAGTATCWKSIASALTLDSEWSAQILASHVLGIVSSMAWKASATRSAQRADSVSSTS